MNGCLRAMLACLVYVAILLVVYALHMRYLHVDVVLYASVVDAAVAAVITGVVLWLLGVLRPFSGLERTLLLAVWLLAGYAFAISLPTVIDRSLSFYILEKLQQRGGGIRQDRMQDVFIREYMTEHRLVDIRLTEQLQSGTIRIDHGCVRLTEKGEQIASFGRFYRAHLLPRQRLIMGRYTDDLTDPFRQSAGITDYTCK